MMSVSEVVLLPSLLNLNRFQNFFGVSIADLEKVNGGWLSIALIILFLQALWIAMENLMDF